MVELADGHGQLIDFTHDEETAVSVSRLGMVERLLGEPPITSIGLLKQNKIRNKINPLAWSVK